MNRDWSVCWRTITGEKIALHRIRFPAILPRRMAANIGYKLRTSIDDVEHDKDAQLILVWIEASVSLYSYMGSVITVACRFFCLVGGQVCAKKELV